MTIKVGDYVYAGTSNHIQRVIRVWAIDRGPDKGKLKAETRSTTLGMRFYGGVVCATIEHFSLAPYAGADMLLCPESWGEQYQEGYNPLGGC